MQQTSARRFPPGALIRAFELQLHEADKFTAFHEADVARRAILEEHQAEIARSQRFRESMEKIKLHRARGMSESTLTRIYGAEAVQLEAESRLPKGSEKPQTAALLESSIVSLSAPFRLEDSTVEPVIAMSDKRTLYVYRQVRNPNDLISWAKSHGFDKTIPPDDLHVTIAFSKTKLDWGFLEPANARITNRELGRKVKSLGDKGAVVLTFKSPLLSSRWRYFKSAGASWDWPGYQPHITITYHNPPDIDPQDIPPYEGPIILGCEIFSEIVEDWEDLITEKSERRAKA